MLAWARGPHHSAGMGTEMDEAASVDRRVTPAPDGGCSRGRLSGGTIAGVMRFVGSLVLGFVSFGLSLGCGGKAVIDAEGTGGGATSTTTTSTTSTTATSTTTAANCGGLDYCGCVAVGGCEVVYGGCICGCDYTCPGDPPCDCDCGGGPYHGCAPATCSGPFAFDENAAVAFDAAGCPYALPPPP